MKKLIIIYFCLVIFAGTIQAAITPVNLTCENLNNPGGGSGSRNYSTDVNLFQKDLFKMKEYSPERKSIGSLPEKQNKESLVYSNKENQYHGKFKNKVYGNRT